MTAGEPDEPRMARPARSIGYAPMARLVGEAEYPLVAMPRSQAAVDLAVMAAVFVASQVLIGCSGIAFLLEKQWPTFGIFSMNILLGVLTLGAVVVVLVGRRQSPASIGLNRTSWGRIAVAVLIAVPACFLAGAITNVLYISVSGFDFDGFVEERTEFFAELPEIPLAWTLPFALFVGVHEEILFRGFLLSRLRALCRSNAWAIILTSAVFGGLHFYQGPAGVFQTAAVGLVLAIVATYARTLWPVIIAHALFDIVGLVVAPLLSDMMEELELTPALVGLV